MERNSLEADEAISLKTGGAQCVDLRTCTVSGLGLEGKRIYERLSLSAALSEIFKLETVICVYSIHLCAQLQLKHQQVLRSSEACLLPVSRFEGITALLVHLFSSLCTVTFNWLFQQV